MPQIRRSIHFLHIGKTGGTSIVHALNAYGCCELSAVRRARGGEDVYGLRPIDDGAELIVVVHAHDEGLRDVPAGDKFFFFLRDPISRFVSAFQSRQRQGRPRYLTPWDAGEERAYRWFATPDALGAALSSPQSKIRTEAEAAMHAIQHIRQPLVSWFASPEYFMSRLADICFIGHQETLEADFGELRTRLGLPPSVELPTDDVLANRNPPGGDVSLSREALTNLRAWYRLDYEFLELCERAWGIGKRC